MKKAKEIVKPPKQKDSSQDRLFEVRQANSEGTVRSEISKQQQTDARIT